MSHTKGKLKLDRYENVYTDDNKVLRVIGVSLSGDAECVSNSKRIVQCWNSHDDLVAALEKVLPELRGLALVSGYASKLASICETALKSAKGE